jgi:hypothetical protein
LVNVTLGDPRPDLLHTATIFFTREVEEATCNLYAAVAGLVPNARVAVIKKPRRLVNAKPRQRHVLATSSRHGRLKPLTCLVRHVPRDPASGSQMALDLGEHRNSIFLYLCGKDGFRVAK